MENKEVIKAAVQIIMEPILRLLQDDPHGWSTRPCATCKSISSMIGKPFGCYHYKLQKELKSNLSKDPI